MFADSQKLVCRSSLKNRHMNTSLFLHITDIFSILSPHTLVDKESACNTGDSSSIPGLGRSLGEFHGLFGQGRKELDMTEWLSLSLSILSLAKNLLMVSLCWIENLNFVLIELCFCLLLFIVSIWRRASVSCHILCISFCQFLLHSIQSSPLCVESGRNPGLLHAVSQFPIPSTYKRTLSWICAVSLSTLSRLLFLRAVHAPVPCCFQHPVFRQGSPLGAEPGEVLNQEMRCLRLLV